MLGVYIHIPFCKKICNYCDFCKMFYDTGYASSYLDALEQEIKDRYKGELVDTLYIGGGTPSCLSVEELRRLLTMLKVFRLKDTYEFTVECNIEDIEISKLELFKEFGVNRLSIGVESFDGQVQKILGRVNDDSFIFEKIRLCKQYFDNINIDLIYAVNSSMEAVRGDISKFLSLDIPHVSCYSLILEEHTRLYIDGYSSIESDLDREMFNYIHTTLTEHGYSHYEISNYAKCGYESLHNLNYWLNGSYYGFGLGAVSYLEYYRISNTRNMRKYLCGEDISVRDYEDVSIQKENDLLLGLRLIRGVDYQLFNQKYHDDLLGKEIVKKLVSDGLLEVRDNYLRCKNEYIYLLNGILEQIMGSEL